MTQPHPTDPTTAVSVTDTAGTAGDLPYDAILLASFGGPEKQEDVVPFLRNVTRGRGIPDERLEVVGEHYRHLGGRSPINDQNRALLGQLRAELDRRGIDLPIYWGNRNWAPYTTDVVGRIARDGNHHVLAIATSAYSSYSSCRQYREDYAKALLANDLGESDMQIDKARAYFDLPGFLEPVRDGVREALASMAAAGHDASRTRVLFSTHSIPHAMSRASGPADKNVAGTSGAAGASGAAGTGTDTADRNAAVGGWYVAQHMAACRWVMEQLAEDATITGDGPDARPLPAWELVYQSRSGAPHIPWLEPDINDRLRDLHAQDAVEAAVVVPIGFVTDHVEVVWDLDTEARQTADELGIDFARVATSGTDHRFVAGLVDIVAEHLDPSRPPAAVTDFGVVADVCGTGCCLNGSPHAHPVPADGEPIDTPAQIARAMRHDEQSMARLAEEQEAHAALAAQAQEATPVQDAARTQEAGVGAR
jgi:ferrochelatase